MQRHPVTATIITAAGDSTRLAAIILVFAATALAYASTAVYEHHRPGTLLLVLAASSAAAYVAAFTCAIHATIRAAGHICRQRKDGRTGP